MKTFMCRYGILFVIISLFILFSVISPGFLCIENLKDLITQISILGVVSLGMTLVIISGGIDLSVGSVFALTGIVTTTCITSLMLPLAVSILIGLIIGSIAGLFNGFIITKLKIPSFIATLANMLIYIWAGSIFSGVIQSNGFSLRFPLPFFVFIFLLIVVWLILHKTIYGRHLYAIGSNEEAARLSGVNISKSLLLTYTLCAFFSAIAGILMLTEIGTYKFDLRNDFALEAIAAVSIGGISILGGKGKLSRVVYGICFIKILNSGLVQLHLPGYYQYLINGIVILAAIGYQLRAKLHT